MEEMEKISRQIENDKFTDTDLLEPIKILFL